MEREVYISEYFLFRQQKSTDAVRCSTTYSVFIPSVTLLSLFSLVLWIWLNKPVLILLLKFGHRSSRSWGVDENRIHQRALKHDETDKIPTSFLMLRQLGAEANQQPRANMAASDCGKCNQTNLKTSQSSKQGRTKLEKHCS